MDTAIRIDIAVPRVGMHAGGSHVMIMRVRRPIVEHPLGQLVDQREDIDYNGSTTLSYQVRNDIQATLSYDLTLTKVNNAPEDLLQNPVSVGLTKGF